MTPQTGDRVVIINPNHSCYGEVCVVRHRSALDTGPCLLQDLAGNHFVESFWPEDLRHAADDE